MKKFFAIAALAVASLTANAQAWIGGNLGYTSTKTEIENRYASLDNTASAFSFAPEVGYDLDENWAVALRLSYAHIDSYTVEINNDKFTGTANSFAINPYVRYKFFNEGNFTAFIDGGITYGTEVEIREGSKNDAATKAIREQLKLAEPPKVVSGLVPGGSPYTDNWTIEDVPLEVEFVNATPPPPPKK